MKKLNLGFGAGRVAVVSLMLMLLLQLCITVISSPVEPVPKRRISPFRSRKKKSWSRLREEEKDSLERFSADVENVLNNLRAAEYCNNPKIPDLLLFLFFFSFSTF